MRPDLLFCRTFENCNFIEIKFRWLYKQETKRYSATTSTVLVHRMHKVETAMKTHCIDPSLICNLYETGFLYDKEQKQST